MVFNADTFHVLAANIQDAVHFGVEEGRGIVVGDGFHFALVQHEGGFQQGFAVTCRAAADDLRVRRKQTVQLCHRRDGSPDGAAVIVAVKRIEKRAVLPDQGKLGGGGAGIDSQKAFSVILGQVRSLHSRLFVAAAELVILFL